jgi:hypothetical protein
LYHDVCPAPADLQLLVKEGGLERYVGRVGYAEVAKDFVDLFMNPRMCMKARHSSTPLAIALFSTKHMQTYYNRMVFRASTKICQFMEQAYLRIKLLEQKRQEVLVTHRHALECLVVRWRWRQAWRLRQSCVVCWESGLHLVVLHREWRHTICQTCLGHIGNSCPICRHPLREADTVSDASSVSYMDYEDPYYDDDQMYQYD